MKLLNLILSLVENEVLLLKHNYKASLEQRQTEARSELEWDGKLKWEWIKNRRFAEQLPKLHLYTLCLYILHSLSIMKKRTGVKSSIQVDVTLHTILQEL